MEKRLQNTKDPQDKNNFANVMVYLYDSSRKKVYCCQIWIWVKKGTKLKREVKAAETREMLQREKGLQKRKQICRSLLSIPAQQYFCVDKIQDF